MKTNFKIEENYAVQLNGIHLDLHNNFEFKSIIENDNQIQIEFIKSNGNWVRENELKYLNFICTNVSYKYIENGTNDEFPEDENTLSSITFFPSSTREINDGIMEKNIPSEKDDLIFLFENGKIIRINCEKVKLTTENLLDYKTLKITKEELSKIEKIELSSEIERVLNENKMFKPDLHNKPNDKETNHYKVDLKLNEIEQIIEMFGDLEVENLGIEYETTNAASLYATMLDKWNELTE